MKSNSAAQCQSDCWQKIFSAQKTTSFSKKRQLIVTSLRGANCHLMGKYQKKIITLFFRFFFLFFAVLKTPLITFTYLRYFTDSSLALVLSDMSDKAKLVTCALPRIAAGLCVNRVENGYRRFSQCNAWRLVYAVFFCRFLRICWNFSASFFSSREVISERTDNSPQVCYHLAPANLRLIW